jgi:hypothetical protein
VKTFRSAPAPDPRRDVSPEFVAELERAGASEGLLRAVAAEFEVAESTVSRWARGVSRPHPSIQKQVLVWLHSIWHPRPGPRFRGRR